MNVIEYKFSAKIAFTFSLFVRRKLNEIFIEIPIGIKAVHFVEYFFFYIITNFDKNLHLLFEMLRVSYVLNFLL